MERRYAPRAPWWRLLRAWADGTFDRLEMASHRRMLVSVRRAGADCGSDAFWGDIEASVDRLCGYGGRRKVATQ